jgi:hypothetical protein
LCPFDAAGNLEKKNQIHLRFVFVNGKKEIRETQRERERERERERCVDLWEDRQLELSERGRERVHRELCGYV